MSTNSKIATIPCHCISTRRAANAITAYYDKMLAPCGLSVSQFSLLWSLEGMGSSNVSNLAEQVGLERSTVVRNLKPLLAKKLIADKAGGDKRDRQLTVSALGKKLIAKGIPLWKQAQKNIYQQIGQENIDVFRKVIVNLQQV